MPPRIAIPVPTSSDHAYNERNWSAYANAVQASGGEPVKVELTLTPRQIAELANTCQAILLPGSPADVTPEKFGQQKEEATAPADLPRENVDELLLQDAHNLYKPILGICFGTQILNVWRSGTLVQDLAILPVNHSAARGVAVAHTAVIAQDSLLAAVLDEVLPSIASEPEDGTPRLPINSSHHQAIGIPGDGLRVVARCPQDGVVEAIEGGQANSLHAASSTSPAHFVLGVQWHPERTFASDPASRAIFQRFVQEAAVWSPRPILTSVAP
jgi:putative glutamine amidotransferase